MRIAWIAAPIAGVAALVGAMAWSAPEDHGRGDIYRQLELFADVLARVEQDYVTPIDDQQAIEAAINGMLSSLDPHSSYMNASEYREMQTQTRGEYGGLGIEVTSEDGVVRVVSPIDGTPAARAGIQAGDYLTAINGQSIVGLSLNDAVRQMRGEAGSDITVTVAREGTDPFDVTLQREIINVRAVTARVEGGDQIAVDESRARLRVLRGDDNEHLVGVGDDHLLARDAAQPRALDADLLDAPLDVRLDRNRGELRLAHKPTKRDVEASATRVRAASKVRFAAPPELPVDLRLDTRDLSAETVAERILAMVRAATP